MKILITGICGFVGSAVAIEILGSVPGVEILGVDNLSRRGSELNRMRLSRIGVTVRHGDMRCPSDFEDLPKCDWVIDAAANPSVLAGTSGGASSRAVFDNNLGGLVNVLEYCRRTQAGLVLLSSSRVYSIAALAGIPLRIVGDAFELDESRPLPVGVGGAGIAEGFSTEAPISLYGATKLASEVVALEFGETFDFPVWIIRSGVLAGAGQFGTPDQGIVAYWLNAHLRRRRLRYIGFGGRGYQVRDVLHPRDLAQLIVRQMRSGRKGGRRLYNFGGGAANAFSLAQLTAWCDARFGVYAPERTDADRRYDIPWIVMDSGVACKDFGLRVEVSVNDVLEEIARHGEEHPEWLEASGV